MLSSLKPLSESQNDQPHLWFLESLDRINRAIQESNDLEQMLTQVLDTMIEIFDCDRAWLVYPCDPSAPSWHVPLERTKPEYPGAHAANVDFPMDPDVARVFASHLRSGKPMKFGPGHEGELPQPISEQYSIKSFISTAIYPRADKPWMLGMHQCSRARFWTPKDDRLFQEIGRRLSDGLTSFLAYRNLLRSEKKYRCIVETASEGIMAMGPEGIVTLTNARLASLLGYSVDEMIGRPASDFIFHGDLSNHAEKLRVRKEGVRESFERRLVHKDGSLVWVLISASPLFDEAGRFNGSFAMVADITELKFAEKKLIEAKESAEHTALMRSRFLDIAAHELRTPVTALSLTVELAQMQNESWQSTQPSLIGRLERQTKRLNRLVVDLLDVSRLDRGAMTLSRVPTDLVSLVDECVDEFQFQAPLRNIHFLRPNHPLVVNLDQLRVQQVVFNLLDNAIKYTTEAIPVEVAIQLLPEWVRICVIDHGAGIPLEQQAELFKPFHRGTTDREERASGLGLGLVVCDGIAKLHGGRMGFTSEPGEGSTFFLDLPRRDLQ